MGRSNSYRSNNNSNNDSKMMKYPKIVGWSVVITMWSIMGCALDQMKTTEIVETSNTAEDMIFWIQEDLGSSKIDSSIAEVYIDNLEEIIINLGVTR